MAYTQPALTALDMPNILAQLREHSALTGRDATPQILDSLIRAQLEVEAQHAAEQNQRQQTLNMAKKQQKSQAQAATVQGGVGLVGGAANTYLLGKFLARPSVVPSTTSAPGSVLSGGIYGGGVNAPVGVTSAVAPTTTPLDSSSLLVNPPGALASATPTAATGTTATTLAPATATSAATGSSVDATTGAATGAATGSGGLATAAGTAGIGLVGAGAGVGLGMIGNNMKNTESGRAVSQAGGAAAGALAGAAIGSVVPGIGTAIGAIVGGVAGGVGGLSTNSNKKKM